jgi:hypothetical protein
MRALRKPKFLNVDANAQVFTNKEEIAIGVKQELTKSMTGFGYAIIQASKPAPPLCFMVGVLPVAHRSAWALLIRYSEKQTCCIPAA